MLANLSGRCCSTGTTFDGLSATRLGRSFAGSSPRSGCRFQKRRSSRPWSGTWTHITRGGFRSSSPEPSASFKKQRGGSDEIAWCLPRCLPRRWKTLISRGVRIPYGPFRGAWLCENAWLRGQTCQALGRSIISAEQQNDRATRVLSPLANRLSGGSQSPPKMPILRLQRERGAPRNHPQLRGTHENPHHGCDHSVDPCALLRLSPIRAHPRTAATAITQRSTRNGHRTGVRRAPRSVVVETRTVIRRMVRHIRSLDVARRFRSS